MSDILTAEQAAEYLQVNPETIRRAARSGWLPGARIGRRWRFRKKDLDELFMEAVIDRELAREAARRVAEAKEEDLVPLEQIKAELESHP